MRKCENSCLNSVKQEPPAFKREAPSWLTRALAPRGFAVSQACAADHLVLRRVVAGSARHI